MKVLGRELLSQGFLPRPLCRPWLLQGLLPRPRQTPAMMDMVMRQHQRQCLYRVMRGRATGRCAIQEKEKKEETEEVEEAEAV